MNMFSYEKKKIDRNLAKHRLSDRQIVFAEIINFCKPDSTIFLATVLSITCAFVEVVVKICFVLA